MSKRIIPFGNRILCKRRVIGEKIGSGILFASDQTADRPTDLADVVYVPETSLADKQLLENAEDIVNGLTTKAKQGDEKALTALLEFNKYLRLKSIQVGDLIMLGKYVGIDFSSKDFSGGATICDLDDIIGLVVEDRSESISSFTKEVISER